MFLIQTIYIDQGEDLACPANKLLIFAHLKDIDYGKTPEIVKLANQCKNKEILE